jgi:hypothetical protein
MKKGTSKKNKEDRKRNGASREKLIPTAGTDSSTSRKRLGGSWGAEVDVECGRVARNHVFSLKPRFGVECERVAIFDIFF